MKQLLLFGVNKLPFRCEDPNLRLLGVVGNLCRDALRYLTSSFLTSRQLVLLLIITLLSPCIVKADGIIIPPPNMPELSIKYHKVDVTIDNQIATTYVDQVFVNQSHFQMEGTYIFPLPEEVSITDFAMYVEGERLEPELLGHDEARKIYEEIVRNRKDPAILEYIGRNMFRARVFPIEPYGEKRIELEYSELLKADMGLVKYLYPLNTEKFSAKPLELVSVSVEINSAQPLKTIYSPSHQIKIERNGEYNAQISYVDENIKPTVDFLLYYSVSLDDLEINLLTHRELEDDGFYLLMLAPKTQTESEEAIAKNVVFVIDTSGSMSGAKIDQAKSALKFAINTLNPKDSFNIIDFSTDVRMFRKNPADANSNNAREALNYADRMKALGGTNINEALMTGLSHNNERMNMLVFLTDGLPTVGVTDESGIIGNVYRANEAETRIFVFGVGYDVNTRLLDTIAQENSGISEYVRPEEDIEVKVSSFISKINNPVLSSPELDFSTLNAHDTYPQNLPDLFAGTQLIQFGRYVNSGNTSIILKGKVDREEKSFTYQGNFPAENPDNEFIPILWATRKIGYLIDEIRLNGETEELVDEIVRLSKRYGIITPYTSFLILEDEPLLPGELERAFAVPIGKEAVDASFDLGNLKATQAGGGFQTSEIKQIGKEAFFMRDGFWTDSEYSEGEPLVDVQYGSGYYFDLLSAFPEIGKYFALGKKVIVCYNGECYRVSDEDSTNPKPFKWDVNQDGIVDIFDLVLVAKHFGEANSDTDLNENGKVDIFDLVLVGKHFGEKYSYGQGSPPNPPAAPQRKSDQIVQFSFKQMSETQMANYEHRTMNVELRIPNDESIRHSICGYQFDLVFDPSKVDIIDVEGPLDLDYWQKGKIDNQIGKVSGIAGVILLDGTAPRPLRSCQVKREQYVLATISYKIKQIEDRFSDKNQTFPFSMENVKIVDDKLQTLMVEFNAQPALECNDPIVAFELGQNYPNPFNPETWIPYRISKDTNVTLKIYDVTGQLVRVFDLGYKQAGSYLDQSRSCYWDGTNLNGEKVSSGIYFYRIEAGDFVDTRKMILLK